MADPAVSVVLPARNAAAFLDAAMESALGQTLRSLEVIAVDDASGDGTQAALQAWQHREPQRVTVLRHDAPRGPGAARNAAIAHARGRWIAPLDADDAMLPERLERLVAQAEARGADLLADNLLLRDAETGAVLGPCLPREAMLRHDPLDLAEMLRLNAPDRPRRSRIGYLKPVVRREFLQRTGLRYRPDLRVGEDFVFYAECVAAGGRFLLMPAAMYLYAVRPGSASNAGEGAFHLAAGLRHVARALPRGPAGAEARALLLAQRRVVEADCFELSVTARRPWDALRHAVTADRHRVAGRLLSATRTLVGWGSVLRPAGEGSTFPGPIRQKQKGLRKP